MILTLRTKTILSVIVKTVNMKRDNWHFIIDRSQVLQPTMFPSVPRLYNKIYDKIQSKLRELSGMKSYIANRAITSKMYYL